MIVQPLRPDMVCVVWGLIKPYLQNALKSAEFDERYTINDLLNDIKQNNYLCWVALEKEKINAAAVTEIVDHPHGRSFYVFLVGGEDFGMWGDAMQKAFIEHARRYGAEWIDALVRPGFARVLSKKYGYKRVTEMISMKV